MKAISTILFLCISSFTHSSGCMHYDNWMTKLESKKVKEIERSDYKITGFSAHHRSVTLASRPDKTYTLIRVADSSEAKKSFKVQDVNFEEGHGCGPVYICSTGQLIFNIPATRTSKGGKFVWPILREYNNSRYANDVGWAVGNVIKPFVMSPTGTSDHKYCSYGSW